MEAAERTDRSAHANRLPISSSWRASWRTGLRHHPGALLLVAALVTALVWFSHMPSLLLRAQFYANDGIWYQTAYSEGPLLSIVQTGGGYLVLLQRLAASASLVLPIAAAPTFFNLVALAVEVTGICYLLSNRMASAIPFVWLRIAIAALVVALPNAYDTSGNLTNAQWHLALIAFLVLFADAPRRVWGWAGDTLILVFAGLTGPYSILLFPIAAWRWRQNRAEGRLFTAMAILGACAAIQIVVIATSMASRDTSVLDAGVVQLVTILGRQLTLGLATGARGTTALAGTPIGDNAALLTILATIPIVSCAWASWRGPAILRGFCIFACTELIFALTAPDIAPPRWPSLGSPADVVNFHPGGIRYFLYPLLAYAISLGWLASQGRLQVRSRDLSQTDGRRRFGGFAMRAATIGSAVLLLSTVAVGIPRDWIYPPYVNLHWGREVARLTSSTPGTTLVVPINPPGWAMYLEARR